MINITVDSVITGLIVGIIAGIGQAIGAWFIMRTLLKKLDEKEKKMEKAVEELHLTPEQKEEFAMKFGSASINYVKEYGNTLKGAFMWWRK